MSFKASTRVMVREGASGAVDGASQCEVWLRDGTRRRAASEERASERKEEMRHLIESDAMRCDAMYELCGRERREGVVVGARGSAGEGGGEPGAEGVEGAGERGPGEQADDGEETEDAAGGGELGSEE